MKLLVAIVNKRDGRHLSNGLIDAGFRFTKIGSAGGFLREGNETFLIGVADTEIDQTLDVIRAHCHSREEIVSMTQAATRIDASPLEEGITVPVGGAQVFVLNVDQVVQV